MSAACSPPPRKRARTKGPPSPTGDDDHDGDENLLHALLGGKDGGDGPIAVLAAALPSHDLRSLGCVTSPLCEAVGASCDRWEKSSRRFDSALKKKAPAAEDTAAEDHHMPTLSQRQLQTPGGGRGLTMRCLTPWMAHRRPPASCLRPREMHLPKKAGAGGNSLRCFRVAPPGKLFLLGGTAHKSALSYDAYAARRQKTAAASTWSAAEVPDLPEIIEDAAAAWLRGKLYVVGGEIGSWDVDGYEEISARCYCFDPADRDAGWRRVADLRVGRIAHAAVVLGGHLYVLAGIKAWNADGDEDGVPVASVERYDPAADAWEAVAPMKTARWCTAAAACKADGKLYVFGGTAPSAGDDHDAASRTCERYDPVADAWESLPDLPTARSGAAAAVLGGKLWVAGGSDGTELKRTVETFDPLTGTWDCSKADLVTARHRPALAVLNGKLHALGGTLGLNGPAYEHMFAGYEKMVSVEKYNARKNSWSVVSSMGLPEGREMSAVAVLMA